MPVRTLIAPPDVDRSVVEAFLEAGYGYEERVTLDHSFAGSAATGGVVLNLASVFPPLVVRSLADPVIQNENFYHLAIQTAWRYVLNHFPVSLDFALSKRRPENFIVGETVIRLKEAASLVQREFSPRSKLYDIYVLDIPALQVSALALQESHCTHFVVYQGLPAYQKLKIETARQVSRRLKAKMLLGRQ